MQHCLPPTSDPSRVQRTPDQPLRWWCFPRGLSWEHTGRMSCWISYHPELPCLPAAISHTVAAGSRRCRPGLSTPAQINVDGRWAVSLPCAQCRLHVPLCAGRALPAPFSTPFFPCLTVPVCLTCIISHREQPVRAGTFQKLRKQIRD